MMLLMPLISAKVPFLARVIFLVALLQKKIDKSENRLVRLLNCDLPGFSDVIGQVIIALGTSALFVAAMSQMITYIASEFTNITTAVPGFDFDVVGGVEVGNSSFLIFSILRDVAFPMFLFVFFLFGLLLVIKQAQLASNETMKKMLQGAFIGIIVLLIFPYIWDSISDVSEKSGLSMMNPLYSHDESNPCVEISGTRNLLFFEHMESIAKHSKALGLEPDTNSICRPDLLPNYLFAKALFGADQSLEFQKEDGSDLEWWDVSGQVNAQLAVFSDSLFSILFVGLTKVSMLLFLAMMAVMIGDIRYILLDVIAIGLPILLVFRCIPFLGIDKLADKLTSLFVPLLFVPIFAGLIMLAGTANLVQYEEDVTTVTLPSPTISSGETLGAFDTLGSPSGQSALETSTEIRVDRFLFSLRAMAVLILVIMSPVMFVPMLGSVASMAGRMAMTGVMTGVVGSAQLLQGAGSGGAAAFSGIRAAGNHSTLGALKRVMTNPGAMASVIGGVSGGISGSIGKAFSNDLSGAGRMMPGAGGIGRGFGSSGDSTGSDGFHNAFEKESRGTVEELTQQEQEEAVDDGSSGNSGPRQSTMDQFTGSKKGQGKGRVTSKETKSQ